MITQEPSKSVLQFLARVIDNNAIKLRLKVCTQYFKVWKRLFTFREHLKTSTRLKQPSWSYHTVWRRDSAVNCVTTIIALFYVKGNVSVQCSYTDFKNAQSSTECSGLSLESKRPVQMEVGTLGRWGNPPSRGLKVKRVYIHSYNTGGLEWGFLRLLLRVPSSRLEKDERLTLGHVFTYSLIQRCVTRC